MIILVMLMCAIVCVSVGYYAGYTDAAERQPYHVKYVENCTAGKRKTFKTREEAAKWVANYKLKYQGTRVEPDCWIDLIFQGNVVFDEGDPK